VKSAILLYDIPTKTSTIIASWQTTIPGYTPSQKFESFSGPGIDLKGLYVGFIAQGASGYWGVVKYSIQDKVLTNIADEQTQAPGRNRTFTGFQGPPSLGVDGRIAFRIVHEPDPITGVWLGTYNTGLKKHEIIRVVGVTSSLTGIGVIQRIGYGDNAFYDKTVTFSATVTLNGKQTIGVYRVTLPAQLADA